jgi:hypothetical protein
MIALRYLRMALFQWLYFRREVKALNRLLSQPINDDLSVDVCGHSIAAGWISSALMSQVSGFAIVHRQLTGNRTLEQSANFWLLYPDLAESELHREFKMEEESMLYFQRHHSFERFEKHFFDADGAALVCGLPLVVRPSIDAIKRVFRKPRSFTYIHEQRTRRGKLSLATCYRGIAPGTMVKVDITAIDDAANASVNG